jgi:hypothetical protein
MPPLIKPKRTATRPASTAIPFGLVFFKMVLLFFSTNTTVHGQISVAKEYQIKALFLYNFTQFVQWPAHCFSHESAPIIIGILGEDPFGSYIDELVKGEVIAKHPLIVERYPTIEDVGKCHLLFINLKEKDQVRRALNSLHTKPVLTISDADNFAKMGGMIRFIRDNERIRLRINTTAVTEAQLVISSKLLRLSEIVTGNNN